MARIFRTAGWRVIRTLLYKELCQHRWIFLLLAVATFAGYGLVLGSGIVSGEHESAFESFRIFMLTFVTMGGLVLCHRLVVLEYASKTQLFLEGLPLSRLPMVALKYALGLMVMIGIVTGGLALACWLGRDREVLTPGFVALLATRALSAAVFGYTFFFLMGFLGRYRFVFYIAVILAAVAVEQLTDLEFSRFGPIALLDERFAFESRRWPWAELRLTWILSAGFILLAFGLALIREGSVVTLLAEKMSHREKVFVAVMVVGVISAFSLLDEKKKRAPFNLQDALTEKRPGVVIQVSSASADEPTDARRFAQRVADVLSSAREYLGLDQLLPVFISRRGDLEAGRYERGELEEASGLHVQANLAAKAFETADFSDWLLREALIVQSDGRVKLERKMWVLDGFALFHTTQDRAARPLTEDKVLALRALYAVESGFTTNDLHRWHSFRERVGAEMAEAVAWSGLRAVARRQGAAACRLFIRSVLGEPVPKDFRALQHERSAPVARLLKTKAGVTLAQFWAAWQEELAAARRELAGEVSQIPRIRGHVEFLPLTAESRIVRYRVQIDYAPADARYSFLYHQLPVFDEEVSPQSIRRERNFYLGRAEGELPESFTRGGRLYWTFSLDVPALRAPVISGWKRQAIP